MVTVRLEALPPKLKADAGVRFVFEELADKVKLAAAVSASPTVTESAPVAESSLMV